MIEWKSLIHIFRMKIWFSYIYINKFFRGKNHFWTCLWHIHSWDWQSVPGSFSGETAFPLFRIVKCFHEKLFLSGQNRMIGRFESEPCYMLNTSNSYLRTLLRLSLFNRWIARGPPLMTLPTRDLKLAILLTVWAAPIHPCLLLYRFDSFSLYLLEEELDQPHHSP